MNDLDAIRLLGADLHPDAATQAGSRRALLHYIARQGRPPRRLSSLARPLVIAGILAAAFATAIALAPQLHGDHGAGETAAWLPVPASALAASTCSHPGGAAACLDQISTVAASQPLAETGRFFFQRDDVVSPLRIPPSLRSRAAEDGLHARYVHIHRTLNEWLSVSGAGREQALPGRITPAASDMASWVAAGRPDLDWLQPSHTDTEDYTFRAGGGPETAAWPATATGVRAYLWRLARADWKQSQRAGDTPETVRQLVAYHAVSLLRASGTTPASRAAAFAILAHTGWATTHGTVTDPIGRVGVIVVLRIPDPPDGYASQTLIIDPRNSKLLASAQGAIPTGHVESAKAYEVHSVASAIVRTTNGS